MIIFPAIDIQDGECVRLTKGDFATAERVAEDPLQTALAFQEAGAEWLHMVDLDGAKTAQMQNRDVFITVAKQTKLKVQVGGGIRDAKTAAYYLENGIERVILGSAAVRSPKVVAELVREFGDRIVVGIDAENGMVKIDGWLNSGRVNFIVLAKTMDFIGVRHIIYTDISRDGTLTGPNLEDLKKLRDSVRLNVIASGGIHGIDNIAALGGLRLYGAICGKSLYHGTLDLAEAIARGAQSVPMEIPEPEAADEAKEAEYLTALAAAAKLNAFRGFGQPRRERAPQPPQSEAAQQERQARPNQQRPQQSRPNQNPPKPAGGVPGGQNGQGKQGQNQGKPHPGQNGQGKPGANRPRHRSRGRKPSGPNERDIRNLIDEGGGE